MKYVFSTLMLCIFTFGSISPVSALSDIETSWYKTFIEVAEQGEYIDGYEDGTFRPNTKITREEFLKILFQTSTFEIPETYDEQCFTDVNDSMWSKRYICFAQELGVTQGYEDSTFRPYGTITSIEALAFIGRLQDFDIPRTEDEWFENYRVFFDEKDIYEAHLFTKNTLLTRGKATELLVRSQYFSEEQSFENISTACQSGITPQDSGTIEVAGKTRNYILSLPSGYDSNKSYPLIFGMHGRTNSNEMVQRYMRLERYPDGAIVVYPAGLGTGPYTWHQSENIEYFDALLSKLSSNYCVRRDEVFVVGHSLGGYFTNKLGCLRGNVIRAISVTGGSGYSGNCEYPVAAQILHRPDDGLVGYREGEVMLGQFQNLNLCNSENQTTSYGNISHTVDTCSAKNPTVFANDYETLGDDPHSWPTGRSQFIFNFFNSLQ